MTTHELAKKLLEMPDVPAITIYGATQCEIGPADIIFGEATFFKDLPPRWVTDQCVMIENN